MDVRRGSGQNVASREQVGMLSRYLPIQAWVAGWARRGNYARQSARTA